jgi:hypothetical protein
MSLQHSGSQHSGRGHLSSKRRIRDGHNRGLDVADAPRLHAHSKAAAFDNRASRGSAAIQAQAQQPGGRNVPSQQQLDASSLAAQPEAQPQYLLTMYAAFDGGGNGATGTSGVFNGTVTKVSSSGCGPAHHQPKAVMLAALPPLPANSQRQQVSASDAASGAAAPDAVSSASMRGEHSAATAAIGDKAHDGERQATGASAPVVWRRNPTARSTRESSFYSVASRSGGGGSDDTDSNSDSHDGSSSSGGDDSSRGFDSSAAVERLDRGGLRSSASPGQESEGGSRMSEAGSGPWHLLDVDDAADAAALADQY